MSKLKVVGTALGTRDELDQLARFCADKRIQPPIHASLPLADAREGFASLVSGESFGKIVITP
jgi:D-arabinose 1-dehydrogenase-like Zn-dependent alcohol dehydrogenase